MIPLRDHNKTNTFPLITYSLITINVIVFIYQLNLNEKSLNTFIQNFAIIPSQVIQDKFNLSVITAMFLHGSIGHIVGNMMFLNIFGDNLEDRLGKIKFLVFYLICGITGSYLQILADPTSIIPNLGASGAIAGLMGGYLLLFPKHQIDILIPLGLTMETASVPAYTMLFYWIVTQLFGSIGQLTFTNSGIAYLAHLGGFIAGLILIKLFANKKRN